MRHLQFHVLSVALTLTIGAPALAGPVSEPNGLAVPVSSGPTQIQLNQFFAARGEPIDWIADAAPTPDAFSPLCGFTATFMLHQADCLLDFAWYNDTGQAPQASDLHVIVPAGSPLGKTFTGGDIRSDPAYAGGKVGFALVGDLTTYCPQTHYSNAAYDVTCSVCNPEGPWITALVYPSKKIQNAFYLAFEDGPTDPTSFFNDGDFNDDVYLLTGLTCDGGGQPCDTGKPGICGPGMTQCTATGTTCQGLSQPAPEKCNGLDDDCNGQVDEGDLCAAGFVCDKGVCVQSCHGGEFVCPGGLVCSADGHCVDPACVKKVCPSGTVCVGGACKAPCDGVVCPFGQVCRAGACVDPCAGVTCGDGQTCVAGVCTASCTCLPCSPSKACQATTGRCVEPSCVDVACAPGGHCAGGTCVDDCSGAACPAGQACSGGRCVAKTPPASDGAADAGPIFGSTGGGGAGGAGAHAGGAVGSGTGGAGSSAAAPSGSGGAGSSQVSAAGCGCRASGGAPGTGAAAVVLALAAWAARRRRWH